VICSRPAHQSTCSSTQQCKFQPRPSVTSCHEGKEQLPPYPYIWGCDKIIKNILLSIIFCPKMQTLRLKIPRLKKLGTKLKLVGNSQLPSEFGENLQCLWENATSCFAYFLNLSEPTTLLFRSNMRPLISRVTGFVRPFVPGLSVCYISIPNSKRKKTNIITLSVPTFSYTCPFLCLFSSRF